MRVEVITAQCFWPGCDRATKRQVKPGEDRMTAQKRVHQSILDHVDKYHLEVFTRHLNKYRAGDGVATVVLVKEASGDGIAQQA